MHTHANTERDSDTGRHAYIKTVPRQSHSFILSVAFPLLPLCLSSQITALTDGSHLLRLSNQNLRISWVTAPALATVPSISEADVGSLVKLRRSREVCRPALSKKEWYFSLSLTPFLPLCELPLSSRLHQIHIYPTLRIKGSAFKWRVAAQTFTERSANSFDDSEICLEQWVYLHVFFSPLLLLLHLLPSLSNMLTFKQEMWGNRALNSMKMFTDFPAST